MGFYIVTVDGEPVIPDDFDFVMDAWTAEAVQVFLEAVNPSRVISIEPAELMPIDTNDTLQ